MKRNAEIGTANIVGTSPVSDQTDGSAVATRGGRRFAKGVAAVALVAAGCSGNVDRSAAPNPAEGAPGTAVTPSGGHSAPESGDPGYKGKPDASDSTTSAPAAAAQTFTEVRQYDTVGLPDAFWDYKTMAGAAPHEIPKNALVEVECTVYDPAQAGNSTQGTYYHIASSGIEGLEGYWTPSNTYWNQPIIGGQDQNNLYDPQVPACAGSPALPPIHGTHGG